MDQRLAMKLLPLGDHLATLTGLQLGHQYHICPKMQAVT